MSSRRPKGSLPTNVLDALVDDFERLGVPPTAAIIGERLGIGGSVVSRVLRQLVDEGALAQPHGERGPYVPLRRSDGTPVAVRLIDVEDQAEQDALMELVGKLPAEKRAEVERFIRFVLEGGG